MESNQTKNQVILNLEKDCIELKDFYILDLEDLLPNDVEVVKIEW